MSGSALSLSLSLSFSASLHLSISPSLHLSLSHSLFPFSCLAMYQSEYISTSFFLTYRGDDQHDQLAVAYQLVLDNRAVSKATGEIPPNISTGISASPPRSSFTMREGGVATPGPSEPQRPVSTTNSSYCTSSKIQHFSIITGHPWTRLGCL